MEPNRLYCVLRMLAPVCRGRTFLSGTWEISRKCDIFESHNNTWEADVTLPPPPSSSHGRSVQKGTDAVYSTQWFMGVVAESGGH